MTDPKPPQAQSAEEKKTWFQRLMEKWWGQLLVFAGGLALYLLLGQLLWLRLDLYINPQDSAERKDLVQALALIMAGVAGVIGIFFTWRGQRNTQLAQEANLDIARRGQITERFTQAIDQLGKTDDKTGKKSLEIRLGAIYSLARTARDSEEDHWPVMEVLTAYVRLHAPRKLEEEESKDGGQHPPELDIQAILTVIAGRKGYYFNGESEPLDLRGTNLRDSSALGLGGVHLERANLQEADLRGADLKEANLKEANLKEANLKEAKLRFADLGGAFLERANLRGADLGGAKLQGAKLQGAKLQEADLQGAKLQGANLEGANLKEAFLPFADLGGANLQGADLKEAILQGANLQAFSSSGLGADLKEAKLPFADLGGAFLERANLRGADLQGANLQGAKLPFADLKEANLQGANLWGADLSTSRGLNKEQLEQAVTDENTLLPEDLQ